ncbi:MAG: glycerate kinase [Candidatus Hodarchaeota archaeon]
MNIHNFDELIEFSTSDTGKKARQLLLDSFKIAVDAVDPYKIVFNNLSIDYKNAVLTVMDDEYRIKERKIWVIGAGKAVGHMTEALEAVLKGLDLRGVICVPIGVKQSLILRQIECLECTHPLPSEENIQNTKRVMKLVDKIDPDDLVIALISGGGSSIWSAPILPITIDDLISLNKLLIHSGMTIHEINTIRKHVSLIKGGRLSEIISAEIIVLVLSDVIGDNLEIVASGPFYRDPSTFQDAKNILIHFKLWNDSLPSSIRFVIDQGIEGVVSETPKQSNQVFKKVHHYILGSNELACKAILKHAKKIGIKTVYDPILKNGDARELGRFYARNHLNWKKDQKHPLLLISGGEPTVEVRGSGIGGRNQEVAGAYLQFIMTSQGDFLRDVSFLAVGTDGIDGNSQYAGTLIDETTVVITKQKNLDLLTYQKNNDLSSFFEFIGGSLVFTGPTGTNVMDLHLTLLNSSQISLSKI